VFAPITLRVDIPNQNGELGAPDNTHVNRGAHWLHLFARLEQGVTREEAAAAINPVYRAILNEVEAPLSEVKPAQELEEFRTKPLVLDSGARGQSILLVSARGRLEMLFAMSGIVLLLCCANVAGLVLLRGSARTGEMAVRASMGATRGRLASLLVAESMLLTLPAALLSLPVALLTLRGIASGRWGIPPAAFDVDLDLGAALVAMGVAVACALAFGHFPIRNLTRTEPGHTLQAYGVRQTPGRRVTRFRKGLATVQIALSMALLAMTAALAQSLANIARVDLGFDVDSLVTFTISPRALGYPADVAAQLLERLEDEVAAIAGVSAAASSAFPVLSGRENPVMIRVVNGVELDQPPLVSFNAVSPGFFRTLGIELLAGRDFRDADAAAGTRVVIVNRSFAERFGAAAGVVGTSISPSPRIPSIEIIGVVADAKYGNVTGEIGPQWFTPRVQSTFGAGSATFYVRSAQPPEALMNVVRETVTRLAPTVPITDLRTMDQQIRENVATERFVGGAATAFAVLATVLAALGLYGVLAYSVAQRSREIGLRLALGAPARSIRGMVFRQVAGIGIVGTLLGVAGAALLGRAARSVLFGIEPVDPIALAAAALVLAGVTLGAAYLPARRASRVDPMTVLRYE
jgi:predicted permease